MFSLSLDWLVLITAVEIHCVYRITGPPVSVTEGFAAACFLQAPMFGNPTTISPNGDW